MRFHFYISFPSKLRSKRVDQGQKQCKKAPNLVVDNNIQESSLNIPHGESKNYIPSTIFKKEM